MPLLNDSIVSGTLFLNNLGMLIRVSRVGRAWIGVTETGNVYSFRFNENGLAVSDPFTTVRGGSYDLKEELKGEQK